MHLLPREEQKLLLTQVGFLAQRRLARGVRLNLSEATALIGAVLQELIRDGEHTVAQLMSKGKQILGRRHVQPAVPQLLHEIQVEGTFPDGVFLVTVHEPISSLDGDLSTALYGSFLPLPKPEAFKFDESADALVPLPGEVVVARKHGPIKINEGRQRIKLKVTNMGDRPIQVGSHYHFCEVNKELSFDRAQSFFRRLDIAAGTAVRFEPGDSKTITLVPIAGHRRIRGGSNLASRLAFDASSADRKTCLDALVQKGFRHVSEPTADTFSTSTEISRAMYAAMFGPTTGDRIRLADSNLWIQVESDLTHYGDECKFGGGKSLRDGMGQATGRTDAETLDSVITNALIVDHSGIFKADVGIKKGLIAGIGKAGNPDVMHGVTDGMIVGSNTEVIAGEKLILTAGAIDCHVHFIALDLWTEAIASGITTLIGGGTGGPSAGTNATTCTPGKTHMQHMLAATDGIPMNFGFTGKGNDSGLPGLEDSIRAGAAGLKLHEDWGSTPAAIDACLTVCDKYDVQCNIHTDTLNESGYVEDTLAAIGGRTIHTYHSEGAGGGHAPDIIVVCGHPNVLPSSTNPTRPYARNTLDEHLDMLMVCHHLDKSIPEDIAFAESRIRAETVAAEDVLHDEGAISIISSDSMAMGRIGEVISRTWRTAAKMKDHRGALSSDTTENDNERVKRYVSKYTINPAIVHGISHVVGDVAVGKLADLVLWSPASFGTRPEMVIKGGVIAWANVGDSNASIPTVQPVKSRPMFGAQPSAAALNSLVFVSAISIMEGTIAQYGLRKRAEAVKKCRAISKRDLKHNAALPKITVDPETYRVEADGVHMIVSAAETLPLTQGYSIF
ncbi:uncharacterized protein L969DRAFT_94119 [Mixia osmundae IAM 14324]|uniref:Urease n=1 Tax=Mixia osmundae (strain CBS 9802 / IAM 14324 / JCM 22182 / KY 12970) TaxID=764103 RepID=G7E2S7_MIXOS|nr:uncharacterized protein L969DRAFT_94119 [Mixia osmundae IAM 14324]KEI40312.1 hypothetical protein L969DRAFT_94119 [Mixia osmundae IAM 14324]GAA97137.1 hypothetical protein E5Q_03812 [Mixia osmundae IAM 14324]